MTGVTPEWAARDALESIVAGWQQEAEPRPGDTQGQLISRHSLGACADELTRFLASHPHGALAAAQQPQPAPELAAAMGELADALEAEADEDDRISKTHPDGTSRVILAKRADSLRLTAGRIANILEGT